jgi:hypothetical protein
VKVLVRGMSVPNLPVAIWLPLGVSLSEFIKKEEMMEEIAD